MRFRATIRYIAGAQRYHVEDVDAASLDEAMRLLLDLLPAAVRETADLLELRRQADAESRDYTPG